MPSHDDLPENLQGIVERVEQPVTPEDIDVYSKLREVEDRSHRLRTIVDSWEHQQSEDRKMRKTYARWLAWLLSIQLLSVNVIFILIGAHILTYDRWATNTFVVSVFGEVAGVVLLVVKYLFPQSANRLLELLEQLKG